MTAVMYWEKVAALVKHWDQKRRPSVVDSKGGSHFKILIASLRELSFWIVLIADGESKK